VGQVTGIVVRDPERELPERPHQRSPREVFGDVHHLLGERRRPASPRGIVAQQMPVGLHVRPASGGVDHDCLDARFLECLDGRSRQRARPLGRARVGV
jgi:hypothetical protein